MHTTENNRLIAAFLGWTQGKKDDPRWQSDWFNTNGDRMTQGFGIRLAFHSSWDWLMPVLKKINETLFTDYAESVWQQWEMILSPTKYPLENVHKQAAEFIKWYNENKQD